MSGWALRGAALLGAAAALLLASLLWWVNRSDLAIRQQEWDAAARARGRAAALAPFVPGGVVDLLPPGGISLVVGATVLPRLDEVLVAAVGAAPCDYRIWRRIIRAQADGGSEAMIAAVTYFGRGLAVNWFAAGDWYLSRGDLDRAVEAFREGTKRATPWQQSGRTVCRKLLGYGAPLSALLAACPATEQDRFVLTDELLKRREPEAAVVAAQKGLEEFPGSERLGRILLDAQRRVRASQAKAKEHR